MIYDIVGMVDCVYYIFVSDIRKCIISTILNFISRNKFYWLKVVGIFLYIPTNCYHAVVGMCRAVSVV